MKDYKEIAAEVFARRDEYLIKQKKRRKAVSAAISLCAAICVVIGVSVAYSRFSGAEITDTGSTEKEIISLMNKPDAPQTDINPGNADEPPYTGNPEYGTPSSPDKGSIQQIPVADRAGVAKSDVVVYATIKRFDAVGVGVLCTLTVEKTLKGDGAKEIYFNISEADREGFMALVKGERAVFFLSEGEHGLHLTHGSPSVFYEAGEDDFRSYDETGLICYYLTMSEIENLTEAGL